jgi:hypothetical protein
VIGGEPKETEVRRQERAGALRVIQKCSSSVVRTAGLGRRKQGNQIDPD